MRVRSDDGEEYGMRPLTGALRHRQHALFRIHSPLNKSTGAAEAASAAKWLIRRLRRGASSHQAHPKRAQRAARTPRPQQGES